MISGDKDTGPAAVGLGSSLLPCFKVPTVVDSIHTGQGKIGPLTLQKMQNETENSYF